jgi:hypothetical protein
MVDLAKAGDFNIVSFNHYINVEAIDKQVTPTLLV